MLMQSDWNFEAVVINNGPNSEMNEYVSGLRNIRYEESKIDTGNWGTDNRNWCISACQTPYIIQTSIQDYFLPDAVKFINQMLVQSPDAAIWNSINHLIGSCQMLDCELKWSKVDWGNVAIKTSIAQQIGIKHGDQYCADWLFFNDCIQAGLLKKVIKSSGILTIHN